MRNVLIAIRAIVMTVLLVALVFAPLLIVKCILITMCQALPKLPRDKPKWIDVMVRKLTQFYNDYLSF